MNPKRNSLAEAKHSAVPGNLPAERVIESLDLLGPCEQILIHHDGRLYRLRRTRLGKLILTA